MIFIQGWTLMRSDEHFSNLINPRLQQAVCLRALQCHLLFIDTIACFDFDTQKGYADEQAYTFINSSQKPEKKRRNNIQEKKKKRMAEADQAVPPYLTLHRMCTELTALKGFPYSSRSSVGT